MLAVSVSWELTTLVYYINIIQTFVRLLLLLFT